MPRSTLVTRGLLALCAFAFVQFVASTIYMHFLDGYASDIVTRPIAPFLARVESIGPKSPMARGGLRPGDVIDLRAMTPSDREDFGSTFRYGKRYRVPILHHSVPMTYSILFDAKMVDDPSFQDVRGEFYIGFVGIVVMLGLAAFMLLKRPDDPDVAWLSATLIVLALAENFSSFGAWGMMDGTQTVVGFVASAILSPTGLALLAAYALRFAAPPSRTRRMLTSTTYAFAALAAFLSTYDLLGWWAGRTDDSFGFFSTAWYPILKSVVPSVMPLACAFMGIAAARGAERSRLSWATGSLLLLYLAPIADVVGSYTNLGYAAQSLPRNLTYPLAAIGITYAMLGSRLLHVGFALNRAVVFTSVSITIVAIFSVVEWALGNWLQSASRSTNVLVSAGLALLLGISIHPIHTAVDRLVDTVLFRKRHAAEKAIRTTTHEVAFITDPETVIATVTSVLATHAGSTFARIALYDGRAHYDEVEENDAAFVTLRASHQTLRLGGLATALSGEYAFPMSVRGTLIGALILGPKRFGEAYAPDEREAIAELAHGTGLALHLLGIEGAQREENERDGRHAMIAAIERLTTVVEALTVATQAARAEGPLREERIAF